MANHVGWLPRGSLPVCLLALAQLGCGGVPFAGQRPSGRGMPLVADDVGNVIWRVTATR